MTDPPTPCHAHPALFTPFGPRKTSPFKPNENGESVAVKVAVGTLDVSVGAGVALIDGVGVMLGVLLGPSVGVMVGDEVIVAVAGSVLVGVDVFVGVDVLVGVFDGVNVLVGVSDGNAPMGVGRTIDASSLAPLPI